MKRLAGATVLLVAAIAATVSYMHVQRLAVHLGQPALAAWLLPLSVDGTVCAASAALLWAAREAVPAPRMARPMLGLGVAATLAANADFGAAEAIPSVEDYAADLASRLLGAWSSPQRLSVSTACP